jgi:hypothetical protein
VTAQPPPTPPPPPIGAADQAVIRARVSLLLVLVIGMVLLIATPLPFRLGALVLVAVSLWCSVSLLARLLRLRRAGMRPPGLVTVLTGLVITAAVGLTLVGDAVFYPLVVDLERCREQASTRTAQDACEADAEDRVDRLLERVREAGQRP